MSLGPIAVALDSPDISDNLRVADEVCSYAGVYKVGLTSYGGGGRALVAELVQRRPVFLDLKLHDIPAQVAGAAGVAASLRITYLSVHATGGPDMVAAAVEAAGESSMVLAVTVLTSLDDRGLDRLGTSGGAEAQVLRLARLALEAGAGGLVCSPLEIAPLRDRYGPSSEGGPTLVVPGIRPQGSAAGDQRRASTPRAAIEAGADLLVVGRPITAAASPGSAARAILESLG